MNDQPLPDFDQGADHLGERVSTPRKPRPRPTRQPAKKTAKRAEPKPAKRVPKKRRVRKQTQQIAHRVGAEPRPLYSEQNFSAHTYSAIKILLAMDQSMRNTVIAIVRGLSDK